MDTGLWHKSVFQSKIKVINQENLATMIQVQYWDCLVVYRFLGLRVGDTWKEEQKMGTTLRML